MLTSIRFLKCCTATACHQGKVISAIQLQQMILESVQKFWNEEILQGISLITLFCNMISVVPEEYAKPYLSVSFYFEIV